MASAASYMHWYLVEVMGDASAVLDPVLAHRYYREALEGFATVEEDLEAGVASDYDIGLLLERTARYFLAGFQRLSWELARDRIPIKVNQWLKA